MKHSCSRCGSPVRLERGSGGCVASQCEKCGTVDVYANGTPTPINKFHNEPTVIDGIRFDSKAEASRYSELLLMEKAGAIRNLKRQVSYSLDVNGVHIATYRCDFTYTEAGVEITEDVKGCRTDVFILKKRLMLACHGISVLETRKD